VTGHSVLKVAPRLLGIAAMPAGVLLGRKVGFEDRIEHQPIAGPARCAAASPVRTKMPVPMMPPMPKADQGRYTQGTAFSRSVVVSPRASAVSR
jgi:hypothetical protein